MASRKKGRQSRPRGRPTEFETTVFRSGNSDAVRLPTRLGLLGKRVSVKCVGEGRIVIETKGHRRWPPGFLESFRVPPDFVAPPRPLPSEEEEIRAANLFSNKKS